MDDLKLLRDFGAQLEHQPPPTLAAQRNRLTRAPRRRRPAIWLTMGLVAAATAVAVAVPTLLISSQDPAARPATRPVVDLSGARNVLLIGSDTRKGEGNSRYGEYTARTETSARADTIMLAHLPADRGRPKMISIPRDSLVDIPACGQNPPMTDIINSAYAKGGTSCLVKTMETLTGLRIDHFAVLDFAGFKKVVDAVGGVEVMVGAPIDDKKAKLKIPAGLQRLDGEKTLGYVRVRNIGDGSDIARVKRQQQVLTALVKQVKGLLREPERLRGALTAVGEAVTSDLDMESVYRLAISLEGSKTQFVTVPWEPSSQDPNRIAWAQPEADKLFKSLR
ncbi:LCP family protein [Nonomuraea sp. NBC_01738]|uniref:LCP family protein n=1 Tax=Nonomuraea sp. NBC_01738 TaxID=2976003 RepID=UPI002E145CE5|nr:LCP family protein [Nonomuraea sp. NBC_01738]